jgi:uncharacterized protein YndB with AHSA1/START domain
MNRCYDARVTRVTRVTQHINAPREIIYRALVDPHAITVWKVPMGMTCHVHDFDARVGGEFRISLTYDAPTGSGKTTAHTDTYHGRFVEFVPNKRVVEIDEFETEDPVLCGEMKITIELVDKDGGTEVVGMHEGLPPGVSAADNELGWRFLLREEGSGTRNVFEYFFAGVDAKQPKDTIEMGSNETIKQAVMAGLGLSLISAHTIPSEVAAKRLAILKVEGLPIMRQWFVVRRSNRDLPPAGRALWAFIVTKGRSFLPRCAAIK